MARLRFYKKITTVLICVPLMLLCHNMLTSKFFNRSFRQRHSLHDEVTANHYSYERGGQDVKPPSIYEESNGIDMDSFDTGWKTDRVDWNDYELMERDKKRFSAGEQGQASVVRVGAGAEGLDRSHELFEQHKFNVTVSSSISLERSIGDLRDEKCRERLFLKHLPRDSVSVIIPFHNEHDTTILRTVHSVVNRSPPSLLREVVLVDDASTLEMLKDPLDKYVAAHFTKVRVIHSQQRLGLTMSRILGADNTTGQFLVVIDAHMEVNYNFLPPLLEPMFLDYKTIACPVVDIIDNNDFRIVAIPPERNAFSWTMQNEHLPILPKDKENLPEPYHVPVMLGCAFAITRRWWEEIGKFDPGFKVWGEEQYEISFKTWMCGGRMVDVPCSRIAHLFRNSLPYLMKRGTLGSNILRLATVWMDEYKNYVFQRLPRLKELNPGDISLQLDLRKRLNCKSFHWYMTNIAPDILWNWPPVEPPLTAWGFVKSAALPDLCIKLQSLKDTGVKILLSNCSQEHLDRDMDRMAFELNWRQNVRSRFSKLCLSAPFQSGLRAHNFRLNATGQQFAWDRQRGWLVSLAWGVCLHANVEAMRVDLKQCDDLPSFQWAFQFFNQTMADSAWESAKSKLKEESKGIFHQDVGHVL